MARALITGSSDGSGPLQSWNGPPKVGECSYSCSQTNEESQAWGRIPFCYPTAKGLGDHTLGADLKIWIDDRITPVMIRLAGVLDWSTHRSLLSAVEEFLVGGVRHFIIDAGELDIGDAWGASALILFQQRIREWRGSLGWEGFDSDRTGRWSAQEVNSCRIRHGTELVFVPVTVSSSGAARVRSPFMTRNT
jgi:hypothetical protein